MAKEIYTFNKTFEARVSPGSKTQDELCATLIEDCLGRGYIPANVQYQQVRELHPSRIKSVVYDVAHCVASYAGKKTSRIIYTKYGPFNCDFYNLKLK